MPNPLRLALALIAALPAPVLAQHNSGPFAGRAVADAELGKVAGREDSAQLATATQSAGVARNSVGDNVRTGDARIDGQAFQNLSGLSVINVNTGNNVAINAAMNVNIALHPGS